MIWQDRFVTTHQSGSANIQVVNGVVYVVLDFDLYALDAGNGKQIWHDSTTQAYAWFEVANGHILISTTRPTAPSVRGVPAMAP